MVAVRQMTTQSDGAGWERRTLTAPT